MCRFFRANLNHFPDYCKCDGWYRRMDHNLKLDKIYFRIYIETQCAMAVRGYEGSTLTLDDLWRVFSCYGEVASVIIVPGRGATVTYHDQCSFPEMGKVDG